MLANRLINLLSFATVIALLGIALCCRPARRAQLQITDRLEIGRSISGRAIRAAVYGRGARHVIVLAGIHGNEPASVKLADALGESLAREPVDAALSVIICSAANPDGLAANQRVNSNGVDINRNFPAANWQSESADAKYAPGFAPASEPETVAILKLLARFPPLLVISL